jgi:hypothetical protein
MNSSTENRNQPPIIPYTNTVYQNQDQHRGLELTVPATQNTDKSGLEIWKNLQNTWRSNLVEMNSCRVCTAAGRTRERIQGDGKGVI